MVSEEEERRQGTSLTCSFNVLLYLDQPPIRTLGSLLDPPNSAYSKMSSSGYMGRCAEENRAKVSCRIWVGGYMDVRDTIY